MNWIFSKSWEFFENFLGIVWEIFEYSLGIHGNYLGILWEFFGNLLELSLIVYIFKSQLVSYIFKVRLFKFLNSTDFSNFKTQLITKSYLNMEGIDMFVKILVFDLTVIVFVNSIIFQY